MSSVEAYLELNKQNVRVGTSLKYGATKDELRRFTPVFERVRKLG